MPGFGLKCRFWHLSSAGSCWYILQSWRSFNSCHVYLRIFVSHSFIQGRRSSHAIPYILHSHSTWMLGHFRKLMLLLGDSHFPCSFGMQNFAPGESVRGATLRFCAWLVNTYNIIHWRLFHLYFVIVSIKLLASSRGSSFSF